MSLRHQPATRFAISQVTIGVVGTLVAVLLAQDPVWTQLTVSHLTSDAGAGLWFRGAMAACGLVGLAVGVATGRVLVRLRAAGRAGARWVTLHRACLIMMPLGFLGVATFPLGVAPLIELAHGTAAYAIPVSSLALMLTARFAVPELGDGFGRASLAVIATTLILYSTAVFGWMPYAPMELVGFGLGGAWLVAYVAHLEMLAAPVGRTACVVVEHGLGRDRRHDRPPGPPGA